MEMETLKDLYVEELKDLYSAEKMIVRGLERMSKAASHPELRQAFQRHQTAQQNRRRPTLMLGDDIQ